MKGISKYNSEGYRDPTAHEALTNVLREERNAEKAAAPQPHKKPGKNNPKEETHGQKP